MSEHDEISDLLAGILDETPQPVEKPKEVEAVAPKPPDVDLEPEVDLAAALSELAGENAADDAADAANEMMAAAAEMVGPEPAEPAATAAPKVQVQMPTFTNDEIAEEIDIRNFGTLVTLQTARWHAKAKDRQAAKDAAIASGADEAAFEASKHLLVGADEKLKRIHKAIDTARTRHYAMTLPWSTVGADTTGVGKRTGSRLLPNTLFMEYTTAMAKCKADMDKAVGDFVPAYPMLIQIAQKRLGTRFDQSEYPNASSIADRFALSFDFSPVPMGGDFQGLADAQVTRLADVLNSKTNLMLENAMQDAWTRLYEIVSHAAEKLADPDTMFHYTMVDKLRDAADLLKHLNITQDQRIEDVRAHVAKHLTMHEVKEIRKDDSLRQHLAAQARIAVEMMDGAV